ncbi:MAG: MotA/TolQ/ExbB proton channel family protein [Candidatus Omnitrophota bacterium]
MGLQLLVKGGWLMIPILICSFFSLMIIIERLLFYIFGISLKYNFSEIKKRIFESVRQDRISEAIEICENNPFYLANILKIGLQHYEEPKEIIKEAMEDASLYEIPKLEKNLHFLSTFAHISPLLGLLGTVVGLVKCFSAIKETAVNAGVVNPSVLAQGIEEALFTTVFGLSVAIPSYLAYNYFVHKVNLYILESERAATELLELLSERRYSREI